MMVVNSPLKDSCPTFIPPKIQSIAFFFTKGENLGYCTTCWVESTEVQHFFLKTGVGFFRSGKVQVLMVDLIHKLHVWNPK